MSLLRYVELIGKNDHRKKSMGYPSLYCRHLVTLQFVDHDPAYQITVKVDEHKRLGFLAKLRVRSFACKGTQQEHGYYLTGDVCYEEAMQLVSKPIPLFQASRLFQVVDLSVLAVELRGMLVNNDPQQLQSSELG
ncbi:hypothetical protein HPP92_024340 [Vanilla planifolia]|uniref:Uncharacterized protein n=1 Tax=Vanilla planifolia TaxID=51239 RepID=A0A835UBD6_VANPL|nr:hypothetical protein HPP92_024340 [Vanilla planifolia]